MLEYGEQLNEPDPLNRNSFLVSLSSHTAGITGIQHFGWARRGVTVSLGVQDILLDSEKVDNRRDFDRS